MISDVVVSDAFIALASVSAEELVRQGITPSYAIDWDASIAELLLQASNEGIGPVGRDCLLRAAGHLSNRLKVYLRGGTKPFRTEDAALSEIKRAGTLLLEAGQVLEAAATRFNKNGDSHGAGKTMQAAKKYQAEAKGFLGEELG